MKPKTIHRLSLGIWAAAAATTALKEVIPDALHPALKLVIPAAVTSSMLAGVASIVAAQDRHTNQVAHLVTQVTEISKSDQSKLGYLRGVIANSSSNDAELPNNAPVYPGII